MDQGPVNIAPTETITLRRGGSHDFGTAIQVADAEGDALRTILEAPHGTLTLGSLPEGVEITDGADGTGLIEITGSVDGVNAALNGLVYQNDGTSDDGSDALYIYTWDGTLEDADQVFFNIDMVSSSAPVNTVPTETIDLFQGGSHAFDGSIQVDDADGGPLTVTLTAGSGYGTLSIHEIPPGLTVTGNNSYSVELQGSIADLNDALNTLEFTPGEGFSDVLYITTSDGFRSDRDQVFFNTNVESTNDAPVNTAPTRTLRISPSGSYVFDGTLRVDDANGDMLTVELYASHGHVVLGSTPAGLNVYGEGGSLTLVGSAGLINQALDGLEYVHGGSWSESSDSSDVATLEVVTSDDDYQDIDTVHFNVADLTLAVDPESQTYQDTPHDDSFEPVTGQLTSTGNEPVYSLAGSVAASRPGYDRKVTETYGTLYLNSSTGAYIYVPRDAAVESLKSTAAEDFEVTVTDGEDVATGQITIELQGVNDRPAGHADTYTTTQEQPLVVAAGSGLLANDSDRDDSELSAILISGPQHGTLDLNPDGSFTYTPDAGFSGTDSFTYRASDGVSSESEGLTLRASDGFSTGSLTQVAIQVEPDEVPGGRPRAWDHRVSVSEDPTSLLARVIRGNVLSSRPGWERHAAGGRRGRPSLGRRGQGRASRRVGPRSGDGRGRG